MKITKDELGVSLLISGALIYVNIGNSKDTELEHKLRKPLSILMMGLGGVLLYQAITTQAKS